MIKKFAKLLSWSNEGKALLAISVILVVVLIAAWGKAVRLRQTIVASHPVVTVDVRALVEVERLRNVADAQLSDARAYILLGSKSLLDENTKEKQLLSESLASFEKKYSLPGVSEIVKRIDGLEQQEKEVFDQAMKFRDEKTESKIIGQFYQSKIVPIRTKLNQAFDEIVTVHNAELESTRAGAHDATVDAEGQILHGMSVLTAIIGGLFLATALLVIRLLFERPRHVAERNRLYEEAKKAVRARDEVIGAVSRDLKEPLQEIAEAAESLKNVHGESALKEGIELVKSSVAVTESHISDILDQTNADTQTMSLRLDQMGIDGILDDARLLMQPLAKQRDIRLQFDAVNSPVLAFIDRERVMRVLTSLIGNAIKFSPKHSRVVVKTKSDQQFVYVSVSDNGPGIPEKQQAGLFDHFWQARKTADQGAGIGLAIVKTIVEAHGGSVRVDSQGNGSTFTFSLPRRRPVGANLRRPTASVRQITRSASPTDFPEGPAH